jgi:hypothetical protein
MSDHCFSEGDEVLVLTGFSGGKGVAHFKEAFVSTVRAVHRSGYINVGHIGSKLLAFGFEAEKCENEGFVKVYAPYKKCAPHGQKQWDIQRRNVARKVLGAEIKRIEVLLGGDESGYPAMMDDAIRLARHYGDDATLRVLGLKDDCND